MHVFDHEVHPFNSNAWHKFLGYDHNDSKFQNIEISTFGR